MPTAEQLSDIEEIKVLKARYLRAMDTKDWELLTSVFSPNAILDVRGGVTDEEGTVASSDIETTDIIRGRDKVVQFMSGNLQPMQCAHYAHMPEITLLSDTQATAIWAQHDYLYFPDGSEAQAVHGYGYYHDEYEKLANEWKIRSVRLQRLFLKFV